MTPFLTPRVYSLLPSCRRGNLLLVLNLVLALGRRSGTCTAGQAYLADKCGLSVPTVRRCERTLERLGFFKVEHGGRGNRRRIALDARRLAELLGLPLERLSPAGSAINCPRTVEGGVKGTRAHSSPEQNARVEPRAPRPSSSSPAAARQGELFGRGAPAALARQVSALVEACAVWRSRWAEAFRLAAGVVRRKGLAKGLAWLSWLTWHNAKRFEDPARRGAATMGALAHAAGEGGQAARLAGKGRRSPQRLGDLLPFVLAGGAP